MTVLMTRFPGFLCSALLQGILLRTDSAAICLAQRKFTSVAKQRVALAQHSRGFAILAVGLARYPTSRFTLPTLNN